MDKKTAIKVLLKHDFWLPEELKNVILGKLDSMSEADIDTIGKSLAQQKKQSLELAHLDSKTEADDEILGIFLAIRKMQILELAQFVEQAGIEKFGDD